MRLQNRQYWLSASVLMVVLSPGLGLFLFVDDMAPQAKSWLPVSPPPAPPVFCQTYPAAHFMEGKGVSDRDTAYSQHRTWCAGLNFQQDPPILMPGHTGSISLRDIAIVGDFPMVQFNSYPVLDPVTSQHIRPTETWTRTRTESINGYVVSYFNKTWSYDDFVLYLGNSFGINQPWVGLGTLEVPGQPNALGTPIPSLNVRISPMDLPVVPVYRINNEVQYSSHVVNLRVDDFDHGRIDEGNAAFDFTQATTLFYTHLEDAYDSLAFIPQRDTMGLSAFYRHVRNDVHGIGLHLFNESPSFGSSGRLKGIEYYSSAYIARNGISSHELMHQWADFFRLYEIAGVTPGGDMPSAHMPLLFPHENFVGGLLEPYDEIIRQVGSSGDVYRRVMAPDPWQHPLHLYAMGFLPASEVPDLVIFEEQQYHGEPGAEISGGARVVTIDDIIAKHGPRTGPVQREWRRATIVISIGGLLTQEEMDFWNFTARRSSARSHTTGFYGEPSFFESTGGNMTLETDIAPKISPKLESEETTTLQPYSPRAWPYIVFDEAVPTSYTVNQPYTFSGRFTRSDVATLLIYLETGEDNLTGRGIPRVTARAAVSPDGRFSVTTRFPRAGNYSISTRLITFDGLSYPAGRLGIIVTEEVGEEQIYYFPHLAIGAGWQTTITYINYSAEEVNCQTDFLSDDGSPLMVSFAGLGMVVSRTDVLPPGGSVHQATNVDLSTPLAPGWARANCSGPVKASLLFRRYNSEGVPTAEAGVNATTVPATRFVTFAEQGEGQFGTGVAYANPSDTAAHIAFTARDAAGQVLASANRNLPPGGHGAQNMVDLFGLTSFNGSLEVTSTEPIVSLSLNFEADPVFSSLPSGEPHTSAQGSITYYFPHLAVGASWQTTITYINYSSQEVACQTDFLSDLGSPLTVSFAGLGTVVSRSDVLPPGGSVHEETNVGLSAPLAPGWARATCSGSVKASLQFRRRNREGVPVAEASVNATTVPATRFVTFAEQGEGQFGTGVAYANPSSSAAVLTFTARHAAGQALASVNHNLPPGGHGSQNMVDLFGLTSFTGSIEITSTDPIVSLSLNFEADPVFSSLPPGDFPGGDAGADSTPIQRCAYTPYKPLMEQVSTAGPVCVTGSSQVPQQALDEAGRILEIMLSNRGDFGNQLRSVGALTAVFARSENVCDLPYFADLVGSANCQAEGGLGGVPGRPATACSEKNLLKQSDDPFGRGSRADGENVCVHELAHTIMNIGLSSGERSQIQSRFNAPDTKALWRGDFALESADEFFAEMTQVYFCANPEVPSFLHTHGINCAEELRDYDRATYDLIHEIFRGAADLR